MTLDDLDRIALLEAENVQLRHVVDDERRHLASLRETVRKLREEVDRLRKRTDVLAEENARLSSPKSKGYTWPVIGALGVAVAGTKLMASRRRPARS